MESKRSISAARWRRGISLSYINAHGKPQSIGADTKDVCWMPCRQNRTRKRRCAGAEREGLYGQKDAAGGGRAGEFSWLLTTEEGHQHKGHATGGKTLTFRRSCRRATHAYAYPGRPAFSLSGDRGAKALL